MELNRSLKDKILYVLGILKRMDQEDQMLSPLEKTLTFSASVMVEVQG